VKHGTENAWLNPARLRSRSQLSAPACRAGEDGSKGLVELHLPVVRCSVCLSMPILILSSINQSLSIIAGVLLIALTIGVSGCGGSWQDTYLKKGVGRLTQEDVRERLGPPHTAKTPALGGDSLWTYRFALSEQELAPWNTTFVADASHSVTSLMGRGVEGGAKPTLYCYRYLLSFSEEKVLKQWKREECIPGTRETLTSK
jgi:hypothetical protein